MRRSLLLSLCLASVTSVFGCTRDRSSSTSPTTTASVKADPATPPATSSSASASLAPTLDPVDFGPPGSFLVVSVDKSEPSMMDHAAVVGWTADSTAFGFCQQSGGAGGEYCRFDRLDGGKPETFDDELPGIAEPDPKRRPAFEAHLRALGIANPKQDWAFARDLSLEWDDKAPGTLRVGAKVKGEPAPSYSIVLHDKGPLAKDAAMHLELLSLSPDGKNVGVVAHSFVGEFSDTFYQATLPTVRFAAMAYNDAGFRHHQKKDWAKAAELFAKATAADPSFALPAYNLACAYARMGDPKSRIALGLALARAGADGSIAAHAKTDDDLASVRTESWFTSLVP